MKPSYTILDHPADLGIEAVGATLREAFEQAALALVGIVLDISTVECSEEREIEIEATDYEQLIVRWLTEILYLYDGKRFVVRRADIHTLSPTKLQAKVFGEQFIPTKHPTRLDVKAVTYHQILVEEANGEAKLRVFLDI